jgi:hypothetical protein
MDINKANLLGARLAIGILLVCILIFIFRLLGQTKIEYWLGMVVILSAIPLLFLLFSARGFQRPPIYFIQLGLMLVFILVELALDYLFKIEFRTVRWMAISYAMLFFSATGGMIGVASLQGRLFAIIAIVLFFVMAILAFYQRAKTGM